MRALVAILSLIILFQASVPPTRTTTYAYDAADRLTSVTPPGQAAISYTYDDNGNQLTAGADAFAWDAADRLVSASADGASETYVYAGDGRRVGVNSGGGTTSWWWDLAHPLPMLALERDGSGAVTRRSTYGLGRIATAVGSDLAYHFGTGTRGVGTRFWGRARLVRPS